MAPKGKGALALLLSKPSSSSSDDGDGPDAETPADDYEECMKRIDELEARLDALEAAKAPEAE
jgi:hypothetical protein